MDDRTHYLRGRGATISLSVDPVRVMEDKREIAQYVNDHKSEMNAHCPYYGHIIDGLMKDLESTYLIVYEDLGKNEGFAFAVIDGNSPNALYLSLLCANKGRGVGTILLRRVETLARQLNLEEVSLEPGDLYAIKFYQNNQYIFGEDEYGNTKMSKEVKPMEAQPAVAPPPEVDSESDTGSGLPDRGSMFHAGLNRRFQQMRRGGMS